MLRDDIIEYSLDVHHSEEAGKAIRKKIVFVTILLSAVTAAEVLLGVWWHSLGLPWTMVKITFIALTILKAGYIVMVFMHLGDERKSLKWVILGPYCSFILYLIFVCLTEALELYDMRHLFGWM